MGQTPSQGHGAKHDGTHGKVLSQGIFMWNIKALALTEWQNDRQDKNNMPPDLRSWGIKISNE